MIRTATLALMLAAPAHAQSPANCWARDTVLEQLANKFGETRRGVGLASGDLVMEIFASDTTGTWTLIVTTPKGVTCITGSGTGFEAVAAAPEGEEG